MNEIWIIAILLAFVMGILMGQMVGYQNGFHVAYKEGWFKGFNVSASCGSLVPTSLLYSANVIQCININATNSQLEGNVIYINITKMT